MKLKDCFHFYSLIAYFVAHDSLHVEWECEVSVDQDPGLTLASKHSIVASLSPLIVELYSLECSDVIPESALDGRISPGCAFEYVFFLPICVLSNRWNGVKCCLVFDLPQSALAVGNYLDFPTHLLFHSNKTSSFNFSACPKWYMHFH